MQPDEIVSAYAAGTPIKIICYEQNCCKEFVRRCVRKAGLRRYNIYSEDFKREVATRARSGKSIRSISLELNLSFGNIYNWMRKYP